jgi:hypothetical protein
LIERRKSKIYAGKLLVLKILNASSAPLKFTPYWESIRNFFIVPLPILVHSKRKAAAGAV